MKQKNLNREDEKPPPLEAWGDVTEAKMRTLGSIKISLPGILAQKRRISSVALRIYKGWKT